MKTKTVIMALLIAILLASCAPVLQPVSTQPNGKALSDQDKTCRQTIQNVYSVDFYCPDNLNALKGLYTDSFNQNFPLSLERCEYFSSYKILKLLSSNDPNYPKSLDVYPKSVDESNQGGSTRRRYYAEIEATVFEGKSMPGTNPSSAWITMQIDKSGKCRISDINGGG
jgi:hypothetical protein